MPASILMTTNTTQAQLNQELRDYAKSINLGEVIVPVEALKSLPGISSQLFKAGLSSQAILEEIGIAYIVKISRGQLPVYFSCSITNCRDEAARQLAYFQKNSFIKLRNTLGISSHWIFLVEQDYLRLCSNDEFIDWISTYYDEGEPECWIIDELS